MNFDYINKKYKVSAELGGHVIYYNTKLCKSYCRIIGTNGDSLELLVLETFCPHTYPGQILVAHPTVSIEYVPTQERRDFPQQEVYDTPRAWCNAILTYINDINRGYLDNEGGHAPLLQIESVVVSPKIFKALMAEDPVATAGGTFLGAPLRYHDEQTYFIVNFVYPARRR